MHGLLRRAALTVERDARDLLREPCNQPRGARDVARLRADGVGAPEDDVVDHGGVDVRPSDELLEHVRAEVGGVDVLQAAVLLPDRRADSFDDVCL